MQKNEMGPLSSAIHIRNSKCIKGVAVFKTMADG